MEEINSAPEALTNGGRTPHGKCPVPIWSGRPNCEESKPCLVQRFCAMYRTCHGRIDSKQRSLEWQAMAARASGESRTTGSFTLGRNYLRMQNVTTTCS